MLLIINNKKKELRKAVYHGDYKKCEWILFGNHTNSNSAAGGGDELNTNDDDVVVFDTTTCFDINCPLDMDGNTALHIACDKGRVNIVQLLLQLLYSHHRHPTTINNTMINIHCRNQHGGTPLYYAVCNGHYTIVQLLLLYHKKTNNKNNNNNNSTVDIINIPDKCGMTVLQLACYMGYYNIVQLLVQVGNATIDIKHKRNGRTAIQFAKQQRHTKIAVYLQQELKKQKFDGTYNWLLHHWIYNNNNINNN